MIPHLHRQLIDVLAIEIVPDVIVARTVVAGEFSGQGGKNSSSGKLQESAVRDRIHTTAEGVIDLSLQAVSEAFCGRHLKAVVVTVCTGRELRDCAKPWISRLHVGEWRKTTLTDGLIAIDLCRVRLVHGTRAHVLGL